MSEQQQQNEKEKQRGGVAPYIPDSPTFKITMDPGTLVFIIFVLLLAPVILVGFFSH